MAVWSQGVVASDERCGPGGSLPVIAFVYLGLQRHPKFSGTRSGG